MFAIPLDQADPDTTASLLTEYGRLTKDQVRVEVTKYMNGEHRAAQDDYQIYVCLMNSITKEAKDTMTLLKGEYSIGNSPSGVLFLKYIISESHVDTNATLLLIREQLTSLHDYMSTVDSDITKFNQHVKNLMNSLAARGATTQDLLANLFNRYAAASDKAFVNYIKKKKEDYDEGNDILPNQLMVLAANKYKAMVESKEWRALDEQAEQIIALQAQVKKLANNASKGKGKGAKATPKATKGSASSKKQGQDQTKAEKNRKPDWMLVKPSEGQPKTKKVNNKTYHWCPNHQSWTIHTPADCKGRGASPSPATSGPKTVSWSGKTKSPSLKMANALQAIATNDVEEDDE